MLSRDPEDENWSRFVIELVIWPQEVTLARWTQPSGPLCLWQCLLTVGRAFTAYSTYSASTTIWLKGIHVIIGLDDIPNTAMSTRALVALTNQNTDTSSDGTYLPFVHQETTDGVKAPQLRVRKYWKRRHRNNEHWTPSTEHWTPSTDLI